jgi:hypothetical protein
MATRGHSKAATWELLNSERRAYFNARQSITRLRRRLINSMAHTPRPRPADIDRWRAMEKRIAELEAFCASRLALGDDGQPPAPDPERSRDANA